MTVMNMFQCKLLFEAFCTVLNMLVCCSVQKNMVMMYQMPVVVYALRITSYFWIIRAPCWLRGHKLVGNFNVPAIHLLILALYIPVCVHVAYSYYLSLRTFPICFFSFFLFFPVTFSSISSSICYLPEQADVIQN